MVDFFGVSIIPNLAPNERYLPASDYGRIGALRLAQKVYTTAAMRYISGTAGNMWGNVGRYHYYLLGRRRSLTANDIERAAMTGDPTLQSFNYPSIDTNIQMQGPIEFQHALEHLTETARIYGFNPSVLIQSFLSLVDYAIYRAEIGTATVDGTIANEPFKSGFLQAKYNPQLLHALWGNKSTQIPNTFYFKNGGFAGRKDYKGGKGKKGRKGKRKRDGYF